MSEPLDADAAALRRERDLYRRLLQLGAQNEIEPFLADVLELVTEVVGAQQGYLELRRDDAGRPGPPWSVAHGFSAAEVDAIRADISRGIISATLQSGRTVLSRSAMLDPRFERRESVRLGHIESVLCTPIGCDPPLGVLYLQGRAAPGWFTDVDRAAVETVAECIAPFADRLVARWKACSSVDPIQPLRERLRLGGIVGRSAALAAVLREVAVVAPLDVSVLLTGESGTGKSQIARLIHDNGPRAAQPMIELNCAAIPEALLESELFGALRGAHSTATANVAGKVSAAQGGTLLLDEVGELPLTAQAKLLQLLQSRVYYPLGSVKPLTADVRVIAATNVDLEHAVGQHRFREDLYYRLQVLPLRLPTLAERREDIADLAEWGCRTACERHRLPRLALSRGALRALEAAEWPGNVRQLLNVVEVAAIRGAAMAAQQIEHAHVFPQSASAGRAEERLTFQEATRRFQMQLLRDALQDAGGSIAETARRLDLTRSHVYNLMHAFGLTRDRR